MATLSITAVKHNGGAQANTQPGSSQILMNENVQTGTIVGKLTGFAGNPSTMILVVEPAALYADRYELWNGTFVDDDGVTQTGWFIRVKTGGTTLMDYEDPNFGYNPDFPELGGAIHSQVTFKFYTGSVNSNNLTDQLVFDTILKDVAVETTNAAPTVTNAVFTGSIAHDATTGLPTPFAGVTIGDDGVSGPNVTVTITLDTATEGAIVIPQSVAGSYNATTGVYTVTGTVAQVNAAIQALQFNPADRGTTYGSVATTFTVQVTDSAGLSDTNDNTITVTSTNPAPTNAAPTVTNAVFTGSIAHDATTGLPTPFAGVTIGDDGVSGPNVTVTITLDTATEGAIVIPQSVAGSYNATTGVYTVTGTVAQVNAAIQALQFNPADRGTTYGSVATTFTVQVTDSAGLSDTNDNTITVTSTNPAPTNAAPTVTNAVFTGSIAHDATTGLPTPFAGVTIGDDGVSGPNVTVTITLDTATEGAIVIPQSVAGSYNATTGVYTVTGTVAQVNAAIQALQFNPADRGTTYGSVATTFTVQVTDSAGLSDTNDNTITVTSTNPAPTNAAPTVTNAVFTGSIAHDATTGLPTPFAGVTIGDDGVSGPNVTVTITLDTATEGAIVIPQSVAGSYNATTGVYTVTGTVAQVNAAIQALQFNPADRGTTYGSVATTFTVQVTDSAGLSDTNDNTITVTSTNPDPGNAPPTLGGVPAADTTIDTIKDTQTTNPFGNVTITDDSTSVTVLVSLDNNTKGKLAGAGFAWSQADNAYKFVGTPGDAQNAIRQLVFTPTARPNGEVDATEDTRFNISVSDGNSTVTNNKIIVRSEVENRAPTLVAAAYNPTIVHDQNTNLVNPFKDVAIGESNANDDVTVLIRLDNNNKGTLAGGGFAWSDADNAYTFIGPAAAAQAAIRALKYNPRDRVGQAASEVTTFTITVKDEQNAQVSSSNIKVTSLGTNSAPTDMKLNGTNGVSVQEYTLVGTEIGTLSATDANGDALTYTLLDNAGGRFAIVGSKLMLAGAGVNFEEAASHQIKVQVSDGKGGVTEQVFTVGVGDQLTLNKRGTKKSDKLNGSVQDDILKGGSGNVKDTIKGMAGDDKLYGEGGNDSILGGDGIDSLYGGAGNDTLKGEAGKDLLKGDAGNDKAYGGLGNDMLYGGAGNDILKGDADNDVLFGEAGNDKLYGGAGNDTFVFNKKASKTGNFDRIYDFKSGQDKLFLDNAVFKKLGKLGTFDVPAKLDVSMFTTGRAKDKNDYLVYKNGILFYDADGSGKGAAVEIVKLSGLKVADIFII